MIWEIMKISIYTDGSCYYKTGYGGAGAYIVYEDGTEQYISRGFHNTTVNRMEGMALMMAIKTLPVDQPLDVTIYSDSEYIVKTFTEHRLERWFMNNLLGVKNVDMWTGILRAINDRPMMKFKFCHVKGHETDLSKDNAFGNNMADTLANFKVHKRYFKDCFV